MVPAHPNQNGVATFYDALQDRDANASPQIDSRYNPRTITPQLGHSAVGFRWRRMFAWFNFVMVCVKYFGPTSRAELSITLIHLLNSRSRRMVEPALLRPIESILTAVFLGTRRPFKRIRECPIRARRTPYIHSRPVPKDAAFDRCRCYSG